MPVSSRLTYSELESMFSRRDSSTLKNGPAPRHGVNNLTEAELGSFIRGHEGGHHFDNYTSNINSPDSKRRTFKSFLV